MLLSEKEASEVLRVDAKSLEFLRQMEYLNSGPHWRILNAPKQLL